MDIGLKKLKFKARRGMLELDLLLNNYLLNNYSNMSINLKQEFEQLMELTDPELLDLLVNENYSEDNILEVDYVNIKEVIVDIIKNKFTI